ncbi:MAG: hypothetical protein AB8B64_21665 [Granulosicoccus sp.]
MTLIALGKASMAVERVQTAIKIEKKEPAVIASVDTMSDLVPYLKLYDTT